LLRVGINGTEGLRGRRGKRGRHGETGAKGDKGDQGVEGTPGQLIHADTGISFYLSRPAAILPELIVFTSFLSQPPAVYVWTRKQVSNGHERCSCCCSRAFSCARCWGCCFRFSMYEGFFISQPIVIKLLIQIEDVKL